METRKIKCKDCRWFYFDKFDLEINCNHPSCFKEIFEPINGNRDYDRVKNYFSEGKNIDGNCPDFYQYVESLPIPLRRTAKFFLGYTIIACIIVFIALI